MDIALIVIVVAVIVLIAAVLYVIPLGLWITALFAGVHINIGRLVGMRLRKVVPGRIIRPYISAAKAGLDLEIPQMEAH